MKKIICYFLLFLSLVSYGQQNKIKIAVTLDPSFQNNYSYLKACMDEANNVFKAADFYLYVEALNKRKVYYNDIDASLDSLKVSFYPITMGVYSKEYEDHEKIGLSYVKSFNTELSKLVVNLDTTHSAKENGYLIAHEICHILGLHHTSNKNNIMYFRTTNENLKLNINQIKYLKNATNNNIGVSKGTFKIIGI